MDFAIKLELPSDPQLLCVVRGAVQQLSSVAGFSEEDCRLITLAVDEALTNIIRHAYGDRHDQPITLTCRQQPEGIEFILVDSGHPVDPAQIRGRELSDVRPGGLGTHFITQIMDQVEYEPLPGRNQMRLVKHRNKNCSTGE